MNAARTIARLGLQEAVRRRVFLIVAVLTVAYLVLYGLGTWQAFQEVDEGFGPSGLRGVEPDVIAGATLLGLNMFGTLFLGTILAVFLTLGAVRGDAERGLLQPLLVRPVPRWTLLAARFASGALVCGAYVIVVFALATTITWALGGAADCAEREEDGEDRAEEQRPEHVQPEQRGAGDHVGLHAPEARRPEALVDLLERLPRPQPVEHQVGDREHGDDQEHAPAHRLLESEPGDRAGGVHRASSPTASR